MLGATNPLASAPGTIRGDYALQVSVLCYHGRVECDAALSAFGQCLRQ